MTPRKPTPMVYRCACGREFAHAKLHAEHKKVCGAQVYEVVTGTTKAGASK